MHLTALKGLGPAREEKLTEVGIEAIDQLAASEAAEFAEQVDIPEATLERFVDQAQGIVRLRAIEGIDEAALEQLVDAGIRTPDELRGEEAADVAAAAGLDADRVEGWQTAAAELDPRQAIEETLEGMEPDKPGVVSSAERIQEETLARSDEVAKRLHEARVVLEEGITDARVKFEDDVLAEARILPLKAKEDAEAFLDEVQGNVVVLREAADEALVRVEGELEDGLPVFKQTLDEARDSAEEGAREVRVKVEEIRDEELIPRAEDLKAKVKDLLGLE
jgi:predicted flap endonuclease-1-like 5' DNA nuclease